MKPGWRKLCLPLLMACSLIAMAQSQTPVADSKKVVEDARHAYYSLRTAGLDEFRATVKPNWELVLKDQLEADPAAAQAGLKLLNGIHFSMLLDEPDKVTVTHHTDTAPSNEQQRKGFEDIYSGMDQAINGFFTTWELFMLNSPLPSPDQRLQTGRPGHAIPAFLQRRRGGRGYHDGQEPDHHGYQGKFGGI